MPQVIDFKELKAWFQINLTAQTAVPADRWHHLLHGIQGSIPGTKIEIWDPNTRFSPAGTIASYPYIVLTYAGDKTIEEINRILGYYVYERPEFAGTEFWAGPLWQVEATLDTSVFADARRGQIDALIRQLFNNEAWVSWPPSGLFRKLMYVTFRQPPTHEAYMAIAEAVTQY